jgi:hypothetical protein
MARSRLSREVLPPPGPSLTWFPPSSSDCLPFIAAQGCLAHCHLPRMRGPCGCGDAQAWRRGVPVAAGKVARVFYPRIENLFSMTHASVAEGEKIFAIFCKAEESGRRFRLRIAKIGLAIRDPSGGGLTRGTGSRGCTIRRTLRIALDFRRWECYLSAITYFCHE